MNRILKRGAFVLTGFLVLTACDNPAQTNESANAAAAATNQAARESAREMHNQMNAEGMSDDQHRGMQGMNDMHDMGNMQGGAMGNMEAAPMNNSMSMKDDSGDM